MRPAATQCQQNTPLLERVVFQVTIIDPTHPLYGHTFPLVSPSTLVPNTPSVVITLPTGQQCSIPTTVTDIATPLSSAEADAPSPARLSVRILLSLAQQVRRLRQAQEEHTDEVCTDPASQGGTHPPAAHDTANTAALAPTRTGTPTPPCTVPGPADSSSPRYAAGARTAGGQS
jgi:hypothetical protein